MKNTLILLSILVGSFGIQAQDVENEFCIFPDVEAEYPGGMAAMKVYMTQSLNFEKTDAEVEGKIFLEFFIEKSGDITNVRILRGVNKEIDAEAKRVIKGMPNWSPARNKGEVVRSKMVIPIYVSRY